MVSFLSLFKFNFLIISCKENFLLKPTIHVTHTWHLNAYEKQ